MAQVLRTVTRRSVLAPAIGLLLASAVLGYMAWDQTVVDCVREDTTVAAGCPQATLGSFWAMVNAALVMAACGGFFFRAGRGPLPMRRS